MRLDLYLLHQMYIKCIKNQIERMDNGESKKSLENLRKTVYSISYHCCSICDKSFEIVYHRSYTIIKINKIDTSSKKILAIYLIYYLCLKIEKPFHKICTNLLCQNLYRCQRQQNKNKQVGQLSAAVLIEQCVIKGIYNIVKMCDFSQLFTNYNF